MYMSVFGSHVVVLQEAEAVYENFKASAAGAQGEVEEGDAAELCNIEFSLAYGGKILLHNTRLRLRAGHRYTATD